jgi:hypothetical protein
MSQSKLLAVSALLLVLWRPSPARAEDHRQRTLAVVLLNFRNDDRQPIDVEEARRRVFLDPDSTRAFYREQSYGQVDLVGRSGPEGDVFGWYTIDAVNRPCLETEWSAAALAAAARDGLDGGAYDHLVFIFPSTDACPFRGKGEHPGRQTWINGTSIAAFTHELGHNLGTPHASSRTCAGPEGPRVLGGDCHDVEYGNPFDVMGAGFRHTNAYNKAQAGWLPESNRQRIDGDGRYRLLPQERPAGGPQLLAIRRDASTFYYLEYRQPFGFDDFSADDPITQGVVLLLGGPLGEVASSFLLDLTPDTPTLVDAPLGLSRSYRDPEVGVTITVMGRSPEAAEVEVRFDPRSQEGPGCQVARPSRPAGPGLFIAALLLAARFWRRGRALLLAALGLALGCGDPAPPAPPMADAGVDVAPAAFILLHEVAPDVEQACAAHAEAQCERLATCAPHRLATDYGTPEFCRARRDEACRRDFSTPAQGEAAADRLACAQALAVQSCRGFALGRRLPACDPRPGTLAGGAPCLATSQCGPGLRCRTDGGPCGVCRPAIEPGGDCGWWPAGCPDGTACFDDRCLPPRQPGEPCKTTPATCLPGTECTVRGCEEKLAERGTPCAGEDLCDPMRGLHCDLVTTLCAPWAPAVALGRPCGTFTPDGSVLTCDGDAICFGPGFEGRTCRARADAGQPCDPARGTACRAPSVCARGLCIVPTIVVGGRYPPGLTCGSSPSSR